LADHVSDVERAKREGKLAVAFDIEGADALSGNLDMISLYYRIGVRHMNLAYNKNNQFAGGCLDTDIALTPLGRDAITEMNRVGMVVDCSHTGYRSSMDIMELSRKPVIFSHSNPRALCDHARNIRDDQIKACARTGGVVGVVAASAFLGSEDFPPAMVRHINYIVDLVGVRHVGLGLDSVLDPDELPKLFKLYPQAWPGASMEEQRKKKFGQPEILPQITDELLRNGYTQNDVSAIMGGNFMRVASEVWQ
jgi:membrane dipeptidase